MLKSFGLLPGRGQCHRSESSGEGKCRRSESAKGKCRRSQSVGPKCRRSESESPKGRRSGSKSPKGRRSGSKGRSGSKCHRRKLGRHQKPEQKLEAEFVQDVNIPDGSVVAPGAVVKQWRVKNSGASKWPEGSKLIFLRGNRELLGEQEEFEVPLAEPGQVLEISCPIVVPHKGGRYSAYFQLADKERSPFGHRFWMEFVVKQRKESKEEVGPITDPAESKKVVQGLASILPVPEPVPEPVPAPVPSKHAASLGVLEKMGFVNDKLNISLLDRSQGNIEQVVTWLLEMEHSMPR